MKVRRLPIALVLLVVVLVSSLGGCGGTLSLRKPDPGADLDYGDVQRAWTRTDREHISFEHRTRVQATYYSPQFIDAYLAEYWKVYLPAGEEAAAVARKWSDRAQASDCFFVMLSASERDWLDLGLANSVWRVYLEDDKGGRARPTSISQIDPTAVHAHFFPSYSEFYEVYEICFAKVPPGTAGAPVLDENTGSFMLELRSPMSRLALVWVLAH